MQGHDYDALLGTLSPLLSLCTPLLDDSALLAPEVSLVYHTHDVPTQPEIGTPLPSIQISFTDLDISEVVECASRILRSAPAMTHFTPQMMAGSLQLVLSSDDNNTQPSMYGKSGTHEAEAALANRRSVLQQDACLCDVYWSGCGADTNYVCQRTIYIWRICTPADFSSFSSGCASGWTICNRDINQATLPPIETESEASEASEEVTTPPADSEPSSPAPNVEIPQCHPCDQWVSGASPEDDE
eukprot:scaffold160931_cov53-Prasinocladus_malaysianus.AAC.1